MLKMKCENVKVHTPFTALNIPLIGSICIIGLFASLCFKAHS